MTQEVSLIRSEAAPRLLVAAAILAAASLMMATTGYSFMAGNHEVYLLEPLRRAGLATFEADWFVNETLQYHGLYATIAAWLLYLDVAREAFLAIFLFLLLATAWAWWRIVRALGGDVTAYLVSVVLYHILLGDRGLGFYSLLQDGQFNAGNVAAVGLLVGIAMWIEGRKVWAGAAFGVAGAFHLNYAVVAPGLWVVLLLWQIYGRARLMTSRVEGRGQIPSNDRLGRSLALPWVATALALLPSLVNVGFALPSTLAERETMPLGRFIDLYVHLRHPHHYDPLAWPWWVWVVFLLPVPFAVMGWRRFTPSPSGRGAKRSEAVRADAPVATSTPSPGPSGHPLPGGEGVGSAWSEAARIWLVLMGLQVFALLSAGIFWWGETFIQLSLWRFSVHAKVLAVSAASVWLVGRQARVVSTSLDASTSPEGEAVSSRYLQVQRSRAGIGVMWGIFALSLLVIAPSAPLNYHHPMLSVWLIGIGFNLFLIGCVVAVSHATRRGWTALIALPVPLVAVAAITGLLMTGRIAVPGQPQADKQVLNAAVWAEINTPADALFLLPPDASAFSINARRGQVVSFKLVPQLSGELNEWDRRLRDVLAEADLTRYAGGISGYRHAQRDMRLRYDLLSSEHLFNVARKYGARYVFRSEADENVDDNEAHIAWRGEDGAVVYDLQPAGR